MSGHSGGAMGLVSGVTGNGGGSGRGSGDGGGIDDGDAYDGGGGGWFPSSIVLE